MNKFIKLLGLIIPLAIGGICTANNSSTRILDNDHNLFSYNGSYYSSLDTNLKGEPFIDRLSTIINTGARIGSYDEAYTRLCDTDEDPNKKGNIICFYTGVSYPKGTSGSNRKWNREHVWAKSHGFPDKKYKAYSDIHHLRATEMKINTKRGHLDFDEVENYPGNKNDIEQDKYGNKWINNKVFEPRDEVKGDVARIMFYMMTKYHHGDLSLNLVNKVPTSSKSEGNGEFGRLDTLIDWHILDPVDGREIRRNNVIYEYQNNRNPYIDHPEYVNNLFNLNIDFGGGATPEKPEINEYNVKATIDMINLIPDTITLNDKVTINNALSIYNTLNEAEKLRVTNYDKLRRAIDKLNELEGNIPGPDPNPNPEPNPDINRPIYNEDIDISYNDYKTSSNGYNKDIIVNQNNKNLYLSYGYTANRTVRLGGNENEALPEYSLANGAYLRQDFIISSTKGLKIDYKALDNMEYKLYFIDDNKNLVKSGNIAKGEGSIICNLNKSSNGYFILVIDGKKARLDIKSYSVHQSDFMSPSPDPEPTIPSYVNSFMNENIYSSLKIKYEGTSLDIDLRFSLVIKKESFNENNKYGILLGFSDSFNNKELNNIDNYIYVEGIPTRINKNGIEDMNGDYYILSFVINNMEGHYNDTLYSVGYIMDNNKYYLSNKKSTSALNEISSLVNSNKINDSYLNELLKKLI